jgi:hypothetical protein
MHKHIKREPYEKQYIALMIKGAENCLRHKKELEKQGIKLELKSRGEKQGSTKLG